ncbi:GreA/GreB family elongation factor [Leeuwenhoekiella sp. H156]|uniref:GreA/GreB family elongation factor n=1 Tax=Leeuwenhoekiella sp. H156 TaxID=3450128 RepID=UPI003FA4C6B8
MSRGFVKEDDQEETPIIPPRAALPAGATNYVTPAGLQALKEEQKELLREISDLEEPDERERRRALAVLNGKLNLLKERLASARLLDKVDTDEVRFGARVTYTISGANKPVTLQIVGVDEADVKQQKIAFTAPVARALMGKKPGEETTLQLGDQSRRICIQEISYSAKD